MCEENTLRYLPESVINPLNNRNQDIESKDAMQEIPWNYLQNWLQPRELAPVVRRLENAI